MGNNRYYRRYIEKLIASNPATITITRTTKTDDGYGGSDEQEKTLCPQTVTIYNQKARREIANDSGITVAYALSSVEKLLATSSADIAEGDRFTFAGRKYQVLFVKNYMDICKQAELQVVE